MSTIQVSNIAAINAITNLTFTAGNVSLNSSSIIIVNTSLTVITGNSTQNGVVISGNQLTLFANNSYGTNGQVLLTNGSDANGNPLYTYWNLLPVLSYTSSNVQTFTVSGTWTNPGSGTYARIQLWGGGGGGASGANVVNSTSIGPAAAPGGGGGGYTETTILLSSLGSAQTVTIGSGGLGNTSTANLTNAFPGGQGGLSQFGSILTAQGGGSQGFGGNSYAFTGAEFYPAFTQPSFGTNGFTPSLPTATISPGMLFNLGGLSIATINAATQGINVSIYGGGGAVMNASSTTYAGNSVWGGGAGGSSSGNSTIIAVSNGGISVFGGNGGFSANSTVGPQVGFFPGGGGGGGRIVASVIANSITSGANGANGYCVVSVW